MVRSFVVGSVALAVVVFGLIVRRIDIPEGAAPEPTACGGDGGSCGVRASTASPSEALAGKPRLLAFGSTHCLACATMKPALEAIEKSCAPGDSLERIDIDETRGEGLASRYRISSLPTLLSVDAEGAEVERLEGVQSKERIALALTEVRSVRCQPL